jgi:hypothetical protein
MLPDPLFDIYAVVLDAYRARSADLLPDVIRFLQGLGLTHDEKLAVWQQLPNPVRDWLAGGPR